MPLARFIAAAFVAGMAFAGLAAGVVVAVPVRIDVASGESLLTVRDRVRALSAEERKRGVEVVLASGEYVLPDGIDFAAQDGGTSDAAPVVWRAAVPGKARIAGCPRIPAVSFRKVVNPAFLARLPEEGRGKVYAADVSGFCKGDVPSFGSAAKMPPLPWRNTFGIQPPPAVFIDGMLGTLAKYPNGNGWITFDTRIDRGTPFTNKIGQVAWENGAFVCDDPRLKRWDFSKGVWMFGYWTHDWDSRHVKAGFYGEENGTGCVVRLDSAFTYGVMGGTWGRKERRFRAIDLLEELDEPGEWWLDRERKVLFVIPPGGTMGEDADIRLAFSEKPLVSGRNVSNIRFEGIDFTANYGRLLDFNGADGIVAEDCRFSCVIGTAVVLNGRNCRLSGCEVCVCGSAGVIFNGGDRKTLDPARSSVENCRIHDFGILARTYAGAVHFTGCGFALRGCEIFNAPHMAMRYESNDTLIESNDIHHVVMETGDAGALYSGRDWTTQGNVLRYNFIHDIGMGTTDRESQDAAVSGTNVMGMYFDDCDCGDEIYGNVFLNVPRGILIGGGRDHPVRNNVFINCNLGLSIDFRGILWKNWNKPNGGWNLEEMAQRLDYTNGVWAARYPRLANIMNDHPREPLYNPVEDNVFIDCGAIIEIGTMFRLDEDGTVPGLVSRMAPIRGNTVIYTKDESVVKRKKLDPRIAPGFRVLDCHVKQR